MTPTHRDIHTCPYPMASRSSDSRAEQDSAAAYSPSVSTSPCYMARKHLSLLPEATWGHHIQPGSQQWPQEQDSGARSRLPSQLALHRCPSTSPSPGPSLPKPGQSPVEGRICGNWPWATMLQPPSSALLQPPGPTGVCVWVLEAQSFSFSGACLPVLSLASLPDSQPSMT